MTILIFTIIFLFAVIMMSTVVLFRVAFVPGKKLFLNNTDYSKELKEAWLFSEGRVEELTLKNNQGLNLVGRLITHDKKSKKLAIVVHGYMGESYDMADYAKLFYDQGCDVFLPDNQAHGSSQGDYIGFGWTDRLDCLSWTEFLIGKYSKDVEIVLFGVSMGASTVMMLSGEDLPPQVMCLIEDCGYDSVENELAYQLKRMFKLPKFPLIPLTAKYASKKLGFNFLEASSVDQLANNHLPILFIHGDQDRFVPFNMVYEVYEATNGPKELVVFEGSRHATSLADNPEKYKKSVVSFLNEYFFKKD